MNVKENILELIGKTPMVRIANYEKSLDLQAKIIVKLESFNPLSSVKDRMAFSLINDAIEQKLLNETKMIVEATSGNTGIGLAYIAAIKKIPITIIMPETMSIERQKIIKALGAKLILSPGQHGMKGAIEIANIMVEENSNNVSLSQFSNPANPLIHEKTTALEIIEDTEGKFDYFVSGIGTGGTITGVARVLKKVLPQVKIIGVEPKDSAVLNHFKAGPHKIQGLGAGFVPGVLELEKIDEVLMVTTEEAIENVRLLAKTEGILGGFSTGAALAAARKIAKLPESFGKTIVVILPDSGERYLTTDLFE